MAPQYEPKVREWKVKHPAEPWYIVTIVLLVIIAMLGFTAAFVPWAMIDIAIGNRAWAYPFKTCFSNTFSPVHEQTCMDNDFFAGSNGIYGAPVTGGNSFCESTVLTVIAFVITSVLLAVITAIAGIFLIFMVWSRPLFLGIAIEVLLVLILLICLLAWILWIFFAEYTCKEGSIFPIHGYSYGWICYVFCSVTAIAALVTGTIGFFKVKNHVVQYSKDDLVELDGYPVEPEYPQQQALLVAPTPISQTPRPVQPDYLHLTID